MADNRVLVPLKRVSQGSTKGFNIDCKRLYLPLVVYADCPHCGQEQFQDLTQDYLSYPEIGEPMVLGFAHMTPDDTEHEFKVKVVLKVSIEAAP